MPDGSPPIADLTRHQHDVVLLDAAAEGEPAVLATVSFDSDHPNEWVQRCLDSGRLVVMAGPGEGPYSNAARYFTRSWQKMIPLAIRGTTDGVTLTPP